MIKIGITGGIGSGKSTVCRILEILGVPVYYADDRAKEIMNSDKVLKNKIKDIFGEEAYHRNGRLNRNYIASRIFAQPEMREALNQLVHPAVIKDGFNWNLSQSAPITAKEAALLIPSGSYRELDGIILVTCPKNIRIKRVMKRNKLTAEQVEARINSQMSEDEMKPFADWIVINDGDHSLIQQVVAIYREISSVDWKTKKGNRR